MNNLPVEKNRRILVIDDNRAIHDDFRKILAPATEAADALGQVEAELFGHQESELPSLRCEIDSAYQGPEGLQLVEQALAAGRPYAMAFVDIRMPPGWDGVETAARIWAVDPGIQIVLCTAYSDYSWSEMFARLGQRDGLLILKKPFDAVEALQLAQALTEKWELHRLSRQKMEDLEHQIAERTRDLEQANHALQAEIGERERTLEELQEKTAFLEAQVNSSLDGILVVDGQGRKSLQNRRMSELIKIPPHIADKSDDAEQLQWVAGNTSNPGQFLDKVLYLNSHPKEISRDEVTLKDGTVLDRYSAPVIGSSGKHYGRIWTFRDITERKRAEAAVRESEERFSGAFEHAPIGMALISPDGHWLKVNRTLCDLVGYSAAELLSRTFQDLTHPGDLEADLEQVRRMVAGDIDFYQMEKRYVHKHGQLITALLNVSVVRDGPGQPRYYISQIQDITERKLAEKELRESNEKFHQLADNITDVFWIRSPDLSEVQYLSPAFERIWGRSMKSLLADPHHWVDFILPEDRERVVAAFAALTGAAPSLDIEYRIVRPDGEVRWVQVRGFQIRDATGKLIRHTGIVTDITRRRQAEMALRESERRYRSLIENARDAIFTIAADGTFTSLNPAVEAIAGLSRADWIGKPFGPMVHPDDLPLAVKMFQRIMSGEQTPVHELRGNPNLSRPAIMEMTLAAQKDADGNIVGLLGIGRDITERKQLESRLYQSQKMETVGKLAGGIAHEFNSILTAIIGQSELLLGDLPAGSSLVQNATEIRHAAGRAAILTRQILAFGRKQVLQPEILDLNQIIAGMNDVLRHLMGGEAISVNLVPAPGRHAVKVDAGQIEQVIINLAMNARDAMPNGGKLILETAKVSFDDDSVGRYPELKAGDYVLLAISDTGRGMSEKTKVHVFEPFFTTKAVGQGTGLGLSTCYGIIKQSGGHISVYSEPGRGTTFKIYLPQVELPPQVAPEQLDSPELPRGMETILLVEDDPALREMAATLLRRLGYTLLTAANGVEALSLKQERDTGHIDLLFTDVVMPHMSGKELADRVRALYPHTKILFTSAYTETATFHQGVLTRGVTLLQKPFTPSALARKIREVLDAPGSPKVDPAQKSFGFTEIPAESQPPGS